MAARGTGAAPVVAGVDGSASALDAARWAAREAVRRGAPLRLVHAFGWTAGRRHVGDPGFGADRARSLMRAAEQQVGRAAAAAADAAPGLDVDAEVRAGYAVPLLTAEARAAQLLVLGSRGLGGFTELLVGSVAVALAAHAACPVVVVRGQEEGGRPAGPVVVGVDGAPVGEAALAFAYAAAAARCAPLVAVHAWQDVVLGAPDAGPVPPEEWAAVEDDERQLLDERLERWSDKHPEIAVERVVVRDRPAHALIERSAGAQLVVVGSRGRGGFGGLVLGSVSHALLHHAACPVAVVRPDAAPWAR